MLGAGYPAWRDRRFTTLEAAIEWAAETLSKSPMTDKNHVVTYDAYVNRITGEKVETVWMSNAEVSDDAKRRSLH